LSLTYSETFACVTLKGNCELLLSNSDAFVHVLILLYKRRGWRKDLRSSLQSPTWYASSYQAQEASSKASIHLL